MRWELVHCKSLQEIGLTWEQPNNCYLLMSLSWSAKSTTNLKRLVFTSLKPPTELATTLRVSVRNEAELPPSRSVPAIPASGCSVSPQPHPTCQKSLFPQGKKTLLWQLSEQTHGGGDNNTLPQGCGKAILKLPEKED